MLLHGAHSCHGDVGRWRTAVHSGGRKELEDVLFVCGIFPPANVELSKKNFHHVEKIGTGLINLNPK